MEVFVFDVIGVIMFIYGVVCAYWIVGELAATICLFVVGGFYFMVCSRESLDFGFDVLLSGEGERVMV